MCRPEAEGASIKEFEPERESGGEKGSDRCGSRRQPVAEKTTARPGVAIGEGLEEGRHRAINDVDNGSRRLTTARSRL